MGLRWEEEIKKKKNRIGCLMAVQEITAHPRLFKMRIWIDISSMGNREKNHPLSLNVWWYSQIVIRFKRHDTRGWTSLMNLYQKFINKIQKLNKKSSHTPWILVLSNPNKRIENKFPFYWFFNFHLWLIMSLSKGIFSCRTRVFARTLKGAKKLDASLDLLK